MKNFCGCFKNFLILGLHQKIHEQNTRGSRKKLKSTNILCPLNVLGNVTSTFYVPYSKNFGDREFGN